MPDHPIPEESKSPKVQKPYVIKTGVRVDHGGIDEVREPADTAYLESMAQMRLAKMIIEDLHLTTDLAKAVVPVLIQNLATLERKQLDYGPLNLIKFGVDGVVVRSSDKLERVINLINRRRVERARGAELPTFNEPLADSFLDLANYSLIAYVMDREIWPCK